MAVTAEPRPRYTTPLRPCPPDFREAFLAMGSGAMAHYRTGYVVFLRWLDECGGDALRAERAARLHAAPSAPPPEYDLEPLAPAPRLRHHRRRRACPDDFREVFLEMGWEAKAHYRTSSRVFRRWLDECGGDSLRAERTALLGLPHTPRPQLRSENRQRAPARAQPAACHESEDGEPFPSVSFDRPAAAPTMHRTDMPRANWVPMPGRCVGEVSRSGLRNSLSRGDRGG